MLAPTESESTSPEPESSMIEKGAGYDEGSWRQRRGRMRGFYGRDALDQPGDDAPSLGVGPALGF
jgi:hypothetical protein